MILRRGNGSPGPPTKEGQRKAGGKIEKRRGFRAGEEPSMKIILKKKKTRKGRGMANRTGTRSGKGGEAGSERNRGRSVSYSLKKRALYTTSYLRKQWGKKKFAKETARFSEPCNNEEGEGAPPNCGKAIEE